MFKKKDKSDDKLSWIERLVIRKLFKAIQKKLDNMTGSWKTSLMGWVVLLGVILTAVKNAFDGDPSTVVDFNAIIVALQQVGIAIPLGIGLLFARDKDVSSEEQRAASKK